MQAMREGNLPGGNLEIREVVAEASRALALLDATRLEELALACQALNRTAGPEDISDAGPETRQSNQELARQAREAAGDMRGIWPSAGGDARQPDSHAPVATGEKRSHRVQ